MFVFGKGWSVGQCFVKKKPPLMGGGAQNFICNYIARKLDAVWSGVTKPAKPVERVRVLKRGVCQLHGCFLLA